jgi:hypothetical protein
MGTTAFTSFPNLTLFEKILASTYQDPSNGAQFG